MIRKWDISDQASNKKCIDEVIARIQDIDDPERAGVIAAQDVVDIVMDNYAPHIYNRALGDIQKMLEEKHRDIEYTMDELRQS